MSKNETVNNPEIEIEEKSVKKRLERFQAYAERIRAMAAKNAETKEGGNK